MADISSITLPNGDIYNFKDVEARQAIPFGEVDSTSTSKVFTATVPGITELKDGVCMMLKNGVVTSASGFTININGLGAKPVYNNLTAAGRETTLFNVAYTMLFVYDETRVSGGCWILYRGYDSNTNTIGYQLRTNSTVMNVSDTARYYKLYFTSADGTMWVPASVNSTNNTTSARPVNQRPIDPFGRIVYTSANTNYTAGSNLAATTIWSQYAFALGYSFNRTGAELVLSVEKPIYVKCAPQTNGSAIIDADTPYVQALPSTADGKIYIFLGVAYDATHVELYAEHPVYWHDGMGIRLWTGSATAAIDVDAALSSTSENPVQNKVINSALANKADSSDLPVAATATPIVDGTATVGTSAKYAREDHVHPKATYTASEVGLGNVDNVQQYSASNPPPYPVTSVNGNTGAVSLSIPTKTSDLTNDSGYTTNVGTITGVTAGSGLSGGGSSGSVTLNHSNSVTAQTTQALYPIKIDAQGHISAYGTAVTSLPASDVSAWAKAATKPTYTASEVGALPDTTTIPSKTSDLTNDSGFITGMFIGSYGHSTYAEILAAYKANKVVYCRASSAANPATGSQTRMAFLAYVNNAETPTTFEFQYYRSVSTHTESQQGDQVYIYTLTSAGTWSVTVRSAFSAVAAGTGLSRSYSSGTVTLSVSSPLPSVTSSDNGKVLAVVNGAWETATGGSIVPSHSATGNYAKILTFEAAGENVTAPITMEFIRTGDTRPTEIMLCFGSGGTLTSFTSNNVTNAYLHYNSSIWTLYIGKESASDKVEVLDFHNPWSNTDLTIEWNDTSISTLPTGATQASIASIPNSYGDLKGTGEHLYESPSNISLTSGATKTVGSISLSKGVWLLIGMAQFNSNSTGMRKAYFANSSDSATDLGAIYKDTQRAVDGDSTQCSVVAYYANTSSSKTLYFIATQNSGSTITTTGRLMAIKIA